MNVDELRAACNAVLEAKQERITLLLPKGHKQIRYFPRGELLSINAAGDGNYSFDAQKILDRLRDLCGDSPEAQTKHAQAATKTIANKV